MRLTPFILSLAVLSSASADDSGNEPSPLEPLVKRANILLQVGQFRDAAKSYTDAMQLSPADYSLYYKRATAYYSLNRHAQTIEDIDAVLKMTTNSSHQALLLKAKLYAHGGSWPNTGDLSGSSR